MRFPDIFVEFVQFKYSCLCCNAIFLNFRFPLCVPFLLFLFLSSVCSVFQFKTCLESGIEVHLVLSVKIIEIYVHVCWIFIYKILPVTDYLYLNVALLFLVIEVFLWYSPIVNFN